jgi:Type I restriction enzyme R protein N terminus (HSDR_N)
MMRMIFPPLNLPPAQLKIAKKGEQVVVWCIIRKKHLVLTPEEWVRQHAIHYLHHVKQVPIGRMNAEHLVPINGQNRRCDIIIFNQNGLPELIVECKATSVPIDEKTFLQTSNYVRETQAHYFWMTNGLAHIIINCHQPDEYLQDIPNL